MFWYVGGDSIVFILSFSRGKYRGKREGMKRRYGKAVKGQKELEKMMRLPRPQKARTYDDNINYLQWTGFPEKK